MAASAPGHSGSIGRAAVAAWLLTSVYYFYQYVLRSAPSVMMPQLGDAFGLTAVGVASLVGLFYYGYAPFSLVAGVGMDQLGPRKVIPLGAAVVGVGTLLFATGDSMLGGIGRFLQGAGGVFALIGAVYIATNYLPAAHAATLIGVTQMFGMAGGSAGQFVVGPAIQGGLPWDRFWLIMGLAAFPIAIALFVLMPRSEAPAAGREGLKRAGEAIGAVFRNPQSIMCGLIAGLLFIPTTIFDMVWGIRFLEEAHNMPYSLAVLRSASVPFGWIIGCPLMGWLSDRIGRRKPVIIGAGVVLFACLAFILYGPTGLFPPFTLGLVAGIASGAAMIPYTVIKEVNRPEHSGTATGVINFVNFSVTALLGPVFARLLVRASDGGDRELVHYQATFSPLLIGVGIAILLTFALTESGPAGRLRRAHN
ncbi:MFS transporter [Sphingomonas sp. DBB INV C78]|uniref:MFS transporter n=1 Tax=Sphingomonas sp. DBB INV C78 TaxID=3349434 RepID=UPI0036D41BC9